jgi:hypothetical protein
MLNPELERDSVTGPAVAVAELIFEEKSEQENTPELDKLSAEHEVDVTTVALQSAANSKARKTFFMTQELCQLRAWGDRRIRGRSEGVRWVTDASQVSLQRRH